MGETKERDVEGLKSWEILVSQPLKVTIDGGVTDELATPMCLSNDIQYPVSNQAYSRRPFQIPQGFWIIFSAPCLFPECFGYTYQAASLFERIENRESERLYIHTCCSILLSSSSVE